MLTGKEQAVYADSAYVSQAHDMLLQTRHVRNCILKRAYRNIPLSKAAKRTNRLHSSTRSIVERVFGVMKLHYGMGIKDWLKYQEKMQSTDDKAIQELTRSLKVTDDGLNNLYGAIEKGIIALDSSLQGRVNQLQDTREKIVTELALLKRDKPSFRKVSTKQVAYATQRMKDILLDTESEYGKQLLNLLVDDIRVDSKQATVRGSYAALDLAVDGMKMGTPIAGVPRFVNDWCPEHESNV